MADMTPEENKITDIPVEVVEGIATSATAVTEKYDENQIQVLEGLEAVRTPSRACTSAPPITAGCITWFMRSWTTPSTRRMAGFCDPYRGHPAQGRLRARSGTMAAASPWASIPSWQRPAVEVCLTVLHAGGKFGGGGYKVSGGLHGVGASVVNALSKHSEGNGLSGRQNLPAGIRARQGALRSEGHRRDRPHRHHHSASGRTAGTRAIPNGMFETGDFQFDTLKTRLREMAFLNKGIRITLYRRARRARSRSGSSTTRAASLAFVEYLNKNKEALFAQPIYIEGVKNGTTVEVALPVQRRLTRKTSSPLPTTSTRRRAAPIWPASATALTRAINEYGRQIRHSQGRRRQPDGRGRAGGHRGGHLASSWWSRSSRARPRPSWATARCARMVDYVWSTTSSPPILEENPADGAASFWTSACRPPRGPARPLARPAS